MNTTDFAKLISEISACFPMIGEWIKKQSPAVFAKWRAILSSTKIEPAIEVVNEWFNSVANPLREPTAWQEIPTMLRREVFAKTNQPEENWRTPNDYRPSQDIVLMPYMDLIRANAKACKAGHIDDAEYWQRHRDLLAQFDNGVTEPVSPLTSGF